MNNRVVRHVVLLVLSTVPVTGLLIGAFVANRTQPYILGLPFLLFWISAWVLATALCMTVAGLLDSKFPRQ